jgi:hypothetical protein
MEFMVGKPEWKRQFGRPSRRWEYNVRIDLRECGCKLCSGFIWIRIGADGGIL